MADNTSRTGEIWILGATGRTGTAIASRLVTTGVPVTLVGRNRAGLEKVRASLGAGDGVELVVVADAAGMAARIAQDRPAVVVNTVGSYAETAGSIARACLPGGHYVDLAADLVAIPKLLDLHDEAIAAGSTLVTGAGFGVLATEAVAVELCDGRPTPRSVHADALASVAIEPGVMGEALAASIVDVITTGGRRYANGRMVKTRLGSDAKRHTLPDGETAKSAGAPSGELLAVQRASGAPDVTFTTGLAAMPSVVRALLPLFGALLSVPRLRQLAVRQIAKAPIKAAPRPRTHSWGHAVIAWSDGTTREGWLRADDGMDFTAGVASECAVRLARGEGKRGAYTPAAAFGAELATAAGGTFVLE